MENKNMVLSEFYAAIGSDMKAVLGRIPSEKMVGKFVRMYAADDSYRQLCDAVAQADWQSAFRAAHTLKGVAQNLGFDRMQEAASDLTEALRGGASLSDFAPVKAVEDAQTQLMDALSALGD